jgi:hypothetical protein
VHLVHRINHRTPINNRIPAIPVSAGRAMLGPVTEQQPPPAPAGWIRLTLQGSIVTSNMGAPRVRLNGYRVAARYGENVFPVPPGRWHVDVDCRWMRTYGQAALDVDVAEGQVVDAFYAPPYHQFTTGRIGLTRQRRPGLAFFVPALVVPLAFIVLIIVLSTI